MWRDDVLGIVNAGVGRFLQRVEVEPNFRAGAFEGFRILRLKPEPWWQGVDLKPGDVVTRVNGIVIEKPTDAYAALESLRTADRLSVAYLRAGAPRELSYRIIGGPPNGTPDGGVPKGK
ncbi:MAG TPA: hypothetical protein VGJ84_00800 [Polyangiaceae bacterium]